MKPNKEKIKILNSGSEQFPFYRIMIDGEEYCATNSMEKAENLKRLLYSTGEEVICLTCDGVGGWTDEDGIANCPRCNGSSTLPHPVVTEEEIDQVIDDVCVLEERIAREYQRDHPRAVELDKLRARQRKAILELLNKKR